jgi:hypothetical protein
MFNSTVSNIPALPLVALETPSIAEKSQLESKALKPPIETPVWRRELPATRAQLRPENKRALTIRSGPPGCRIYPIVGDYRLPRPDGPNWFRIKGELWKV